MLTDEQLDNWFTYHEPSKEQHTMYVAIRNAESECQALFSSARAGVQVTHDQVNTATRTFAEVIDGFAPDCDDKTAAIRCVRLARNAMNEWIACISAYQPSDIDCYYEARRKLVLARWQANSAIACGGK